MPNTVPAADSGLPTPEPDGEGTQFDRLYAAWLRARAVTADPDVEASAEQLRAAVDTGRALLVFPSGCERQLWMKWEVLQLWVEDDIRDGSATDGRTIMALASVKADLLRVEIGGVA